MDEGVRDGIKGPGHVHHQDEPLLLLVHARIKVPGHVSDVGVPLTPFHEALLSRADDLLQGRLNRLFDPGGHEPVVRVGD